MRKIINRVSKMDAMHYKLFSNKLNSQKFTKLLFFIKAKQVI